MKTNANKTFRVTSTETGSVVADHELETVYNKPLATWCAKHPRFGACCDPNPEKAARRLFTEAGRLVIKVTEV